MWGEMHYDIVSAFIKSIRGGGTSDAGNFTGWYQCMIEGAKTHRSWHDGWSSVPSEDIGLHNPNALLLLQCSLPMP